MDLEDATTEIDRALIAGGLATHWVVNTPDTLRITFEDGTTAMVTVALGDGSE